MEEKLIKLAVLAVPGFKVFADNMKIIDKVSNNIDESKINIKLFTNIIFKTRAEINSMDESILTAIVKDILDLLIINNIAKPTTVVTDLNNINLVKFDFTFPDDPEKYSLNLSEYFNAIDNNGSFAVSTNFNNDIRKLLNLFIKVFKKK